VVRLLEIVSILGLSLVLTISSRTKSGWRWYQQIRKQENRVKSLQSLLLFKLP